MPWSKRVLPPVLMLVISAALLVQLPLMAAERSDAYVWFHPIQDVRKLLLDHFVEEPDVDALQRAAIAGMIEALDDPYTEFIPYEDHDDFEKATGGTYVGIGAEVRIENGWLTIVTPMPGSPAIEAGIRAGDQIRAIDGVSTKGEPITESINRLTGEPGTVVTVSVHHEGDPEDVTEEIVVERRRIQVETVEGVHRNRDAWEHFLDPEQKIGYVRLTQFTGTTTDELERAVRGMLVQGLRGLVLDLRFNPGGRLDQAIRVSDLFLDHGGIVSIKGRSVPEQKWEAHSPGTLPDFPMIVMVNGQSASASEIVAGALKDNGRAVVLGTRTFGKGKVQDVKELPGGAGHLKLTTAYYYLPSGRNLHRFEDADHPNARTWGVDPTDGFYVPMTDAEYRQMNRIQRELDVIRDGNGEGDWSDPQWIMSRLKDPQLSAAVEAMQIRLEDGEWKPTGRTMDASDELMAELQRTERQRLFLEEQLERVVEQIGHLRALMPEEELAKGPTDLIPSDQVLVGGLLEVKDAQGNVVATLRITDQDNLEAALFNAGGVEPVELETPADAPSN